MRHVLKDNQRRSLTTSQKVPKRHTTLVQFASRQIKMKLTTDRHDWKLRHKRTLLSNCWVSFIPFTIGSNTTSLHRVRVHLFCHTNWYQGEKRNSIHDSPRASEAD